MELLSPAVQAELTQILTNLAISVIVAGFAFVSRAVHGWINANKNNKNIEFLLQVATIGVQAAEQLYKSGGGDAKQAYAFEYVKQELKNRNIPIDVDQIRTAIESAVLAEFNYPQAVEPANPPTVTTVSVEPGPTSAEG